MQKTESSPKILIIGGVACGSKVAARLARVSPNADITMLERGPDLSYANCGFPFFIGDEVKDQKGLTHTGFGVARDDAYFEQYARTKALTGHEALSIDREKKSVEVKVAATGEIKNFSYDKLVIATGASPIRPKLPGMELKNVFTLWTLRDALQIHESLTAEGKSPSNVVVVGAGLIGTEIAEAFKHRGLNVTMLDALPRPLFTIAGEEFGSLIQKEVERNGITFYGDEKLVSLGGSTVVEEVHTDKRVIKADLVIVSIGVRPNLDLARNAGLSIGRFGIAVNSRMQTSDPDIYAGGDCVESTDVVAGAPAWQPMGSTANRHGRVIADNIAGIPTRFTGVGGTAIARVFGWTFGRTGLTLESARNAGFDPIELTASNPDIPTFMPGVAIITLRLVADRKTRKILGFQAIGAGRIDKRLDVAATAIKGKLTIDDLADADLAYAPPFASALDPMTHTANALRNKLDGLLKSSSPREIKTRLESGENILLLDVRTAMELKNFGVIKGENMNIPLGELPKRLNDVPRDRPVAIVCKIGARAWSAYTLLEQAGFTNVEVLEGGFTGWPYDKAALN